MIQWRRLSTTTSTMVIARLLPVVILLLFIPMLGQAFDISTARGIATYNFNSFQGGHQPQLPCSCCRHCPSRWQTTTTTTITTRDKRPERLTFLSWCPSLLSLSAQPGDDANDKEEESEDNMGNADNTGVVRPSGGSDEYDDDDDSGKFWDGIFSRFTNPRIDDPALPLSDALVAQIIAPTMEIAWLSLNHAPSPTWLRPISTAQLSSRVDLFASSSPRGSLLAPALIHGAALAVCWLAGALAARAYERDALILLTRDDDTMDTNNIHNNNRRNNPNDGNVYNNNINQSNQPHGAVVARGAPIAVLQAGAFATGLLILATQMDLFVEFGFQFIQYGDSPETDFRIVVAVIEVVNDVVFEAVTLFVWRMFLALQQQQPR